MIRLLLVTVLFAMASSVSAHESDGHREHYDEAKRCYVVAHFIASVYREEGRALPDNKKPGFSISKLYLPVLAYEGDKLGMSQADILSDLNDARENFLKSTLASLNMLPIDAQAQGYNQIVNEANACGSLPSFRLASE